MVAFLDQQFREIAHGVGADVDVVLGLDLARGGDEAGQILARDDCRLHRDHAALAIYGAGIDTRAGHDQRAQVMIIFHLGFTTKISHCSR